MTNTSGAGMCTKMGLANRNTWSIWISGIHYESYHHEGSCMLLLLLLQVSTPYRWHGVFRGNAVGIKERKQSPKVPYFRIIPMRYACKVCCFTKLLSLWIYYALGFFVCHPFGAVGQPAGWAACLCLYQLVNRKLNWGSGCVPSVFRTNKNYSAKLLPSFVRRSVSVPVRIHLVGIFLLPFLFTAFCNQRM